MTHFPVLTIETAPTEARRTLEGTVAKLGRVPAAAAMLANSPETLKGFNTVNSIFEKTTLDPVEREVLVMTVATRNACHLCVAMHTGMLTRQQADPELIEALRAGTTLPDPRLEALRLFVREVMDHRGAVPADRLEAFLAAGFTARNALEVTLGIGAYTISTFANRLVGAPLDEVMQPFAWEGEPS